MKLKSPFLVKPHTRVRLSRLDTASTGGFKSSDAVEPLLVKHREALDARQELFYASRQKAMLIVLQGMDTAGKDGTIRHIFTGINPQGCDVTPFKVPTLLEASHDFLWRVHAAVPPRGMIGIFNRSHYEDVLSPVVHKVISRKAARRHIDEINAFEAMLAESDVVILKFFLHISAAEQKRRLQTRIDTPDKQWKLAQSDFKERKFWDGYTEAYEEIFARTSHKHAPWFVIPSDYKWYRNLAVSQIVLEAMQGLKLKYPASTVDPSSIKL